MSYSPSITEAKLMTAVGNWLCTTLGLMPENVVQAHDNRVSSPNAEYVQMDSILGVRLATNGTDYDNVAETVTETQPIKVGVQLDCFGAHANDWARVITTLFRSSQSVDFFDPYGIAPLYHDDARHMPVINGENQFELRWMITVYFQCNVAIVAPMQFMSTAKIGVINVDATYPQL